MQTEGKHTLKSQDNSESSSSRILQQYSASRSLDLLPLILKIGRRINVFTNA